MTTVHPECDKWACADAVGPTLSSFLDWLASQGVSMTRYEERPGTPCPHKGTPRHVLIERGVVHGLVDGDGGGRRYRCPECGDDLRGVRSDHNWIEEPFAGHVPAGGHSALIYEYLGIDPRAREAELRAILAAAAEVLP